MKILQTMGVMILATASGNLACADWFVRPTAGHITFQNSHYSGRMTGGIAGGVTLGPERTHELNLELDYASWHYQDVGHVARLSGPDTLGDGKLQPIMLNYRFCFGPKSARWRFYLGPAIGLTNIRGDMTQHFSGRLPASEHLKGWKTTISGVAGVQIAITARTSIDLGYRYIQISNFATALSGGHLVPNTISLGDLRAQIAAVGLAVRF